MSPVTTSNKKKRARKKWGLVLVLGTVALGASCSSVIKGQSAALDRGREGDDAKPHVDLSKYVKSREQTPPSNTPPDLLADDPTAPGRMKWQNPKLWPRNYKFAIAVAPLREDFRRSPPEGTDPNGEPRSNFSSRTPEAPVEDDGKAADGTKRKQAVLPPTDGLFGFEVKTTGERTFDPSKAENASNPKVTEPPKETPKEQPPKEQPPKETPPKETPKEEPPKVTEPPKETPVEPPVEEKRPSRIGMRDGTASSKGFAATGAEDPTARGPATTSEKPSDTAASERVRHIREISEKEGMNFSIDSDKFQERMKSLLEEFRIFENVDPIKYGDDQKSLDGLFKQADQRKDDFLLVCSLRRNKVSYRGVDLGPAALDNTIEFLFLFNEFWSPIKREQYECDVELYARLYDVRSRHLILDQTFDGRDTLMISTAQRGWHPLRNWISATGIDISKEGLFYDTGEYVRPGAWIDMEIKLLDSLQNTVKQEIDDERFDVETNRLHDLQTNEVRKLDKRQIALVVGISEYGPAAQAKLVEWAADSTDPAKIDAAQKELVKKYDGQPVKLGTRPYAETDAARIQKELLNRPGALESSGGLSDASVTANVQTVLGKDATVKELRAAFRQVARARQDDRVFVYLNGETLVMDDPASVDAPPKHYFLPYDIDLGEVSKLYKESPAKAKTYLDQNAISFDWIEACFYRDSAQDHIYLQSRHSLLVVDCSFPGTYTGTKFCPRRAEQVKKQQQQAPLIPVVPPGITQPLPEKGSEKQPEKQPEPPAKEPEKQPEKQPEPPAKEPEKKPEPEKAPESDLTPEEKQQRPQRIGFVNPSRFQSTMVWAQTAPVGSAGVAAVASGATYSVTTGFLERIAQGGQGRYVILTAGPGEASLDVPAVKMGGFVYYFTQFLDPLKQTRFARLREANGDVVARKIVDYTRDRLESESRQAGQPQHVLSFGDKERTYILLLGQR